MVSHCDDFKFHRTPKNAPRRVQPPGWTEIFRPTPFTGVRTENLTLLGRNDTCGNCQLSTVHCQLSTANCPWATGTPHTAPSQKSPDAPAPRNRDYFSPYKYTPFAFHPKTPTFPAPISLPFPARRGVRPFPESNCKLSVIPVHSPHPSTSVSLCQPPKIIVDNTSHL